MPEKESLWEKILPRAEKILHLVDESRPKGLFDISPAIYLHIAAMFWRAFRLYNGVLILLKADLPEEAAILARSLFEESLRLQELAGNDKNRDALILGWANSSAGELKGLFEVAKVCGLDEDPAPTISIIEDRRHKVEETCAQRGIQRSKPFMSVKDAAIMFDRKVEYWIYEWAHEAVHGSEGAWIFSRKVPAQDTAGLYSKNDDPILLGGIAEFAARALVDATKATSAIFGWQLAPGLEEAIGEIERILKANTGRT